MLSTARGRGRALSTLRHALSTTAYSSGEGFLGCLGHGGFTDEDVARAIEAKGISIKQAAVGWGHSALLTEDGDVLVFGRTHDFKSVLSLVNMNNRLPFMVTLQNWATGGSGVESLTPELIALPEGEKAVSVACSAALTAILSDSGEVYCFGLNHHGQCGLGHDSVRVWEPEMVQGLAGERVVHMSLGFSHAIVATESGRAFTWGKGERGQLGRVENKARLVAEPIVTTEETRGLDIVEVGAGFTHTMARTACGKVLTWGKLQGLEEDGDKSVYTDQQTPRLVDFDGVVSELCASVFHTTIRTKDRKTYMLGMRGHNAASTSITISDPLKAMVQQTPLEFSMTGTALEGKEFKLAKGFDRSIAVTSEGEVFAWTWDAAPELLGGAPPGVRMAEVGWKHALYVAE